MPKRVSVRSQTILVGSISLIIVLGSVLVGGFEFLELKARDAAINLRGIVAPVPSIVILAIDDESLTQTGLQWPWQRSYLASIIEKLSQGKPKVIAIDIAFYEQAPGDEKLSDAFRRAGNVLLVNQITVVSDPLYRVEQLSTPVKSLASSAAAIGLSNIPRDPDGFVRRVLAFQNHEGQIYYHWAVRAAAIYLDRTLPATPTQTGFDLGNRKIPLDEQSLAINYRGPARTIKHVSAYQVVNGDVSPDVFKDKIVLFGATTETLHDTYPTPFRGDALPMPGVEIGANAIDTILTGEFIHHWGTGATLAITFLAGLIGLALNFQQRPVVALLLFGGILFLYALVWEFAFAFSNLLIPLIAPESALILCFVVPSAERVVAEDAEKRRVRGIFEQFISPPMVARLIESGVDSTRGQRAELTILFSDIRGFTTLSEGLRPDEVVSILNEYLEAMTGVIFRHGGTVDKFEGDAILAFWGAPSPDPQHALKAMRASMDMRIELSRLREKWAASGSVGKFEIGIGLNTGEVFVGLIGSSKRLNYTVIGDNVNLAARLQDLTKEFRWPLLISGSTYEQIKDDFDAEFIEERLVKGKTIPVAIYRVLGRKGVREEYLSELQI